MRIGVDLGGTNIAVGLVDEEGRIVATGSRPTKPERGYEAVAKDIADIAIELIKRSNLSGSDIKSMGIGVPGVADSERGIVIRAVNLFWTKALRLAISGGAPLAPEIQRGFEEKFNFPLVEGYGLSEAAPVALLNPLEPNAIRKPGSVGLPLPCVEAKIVDENDNELPVGEVGELVLRGPNIMVGYHNMPEETAQTLRGGWLHTGDLAKKDEDGYFYIVDRLKDMIILGGFNVYPREVEDALLEHPDVLEAAVIGVGDPLKGEEVKAFVVLKEGAKADKKELQNFLKYKLASYKIPKIFEFVPELPKNAAGKIQKKLLK